MATIVNNPNGSNDSGGSAGWIVAIVAVIILLFVAFFIFGNNASEERDTTQNVPEPTDVSDDRNVPVTIPTFNSTTTVTSTTTTNP